MTIESHEYNLSSNENKIVTTELTNTDVNIDGETQTLDEVYDICYAKNMTNKTIDEDQYVALVGRSDDDFVLSLRKRSDLN